MIMDQQKLIESVNVLIGLRNVCKQAIAANEQVIEVPAVAATDKNPGKPASKRSTGQLPNASNNLFVAATNLIGHLKNIGGSQDDIAALEKALNSPLPPAQPPVAANASKAPAPATPSGAAVK